MIADATRVPPVLVLGGGLSALGTLRTLGRAGIRAWTVPDEDDFVRRSRWYRPAPCRQTGEALPAYLARLPYDRAVLVACSDSGTADVARLPPDVRERFPAAVPDPAVLGLLVDKLGFARLLDDLGVPHPHTVAIEAIADLDAVPERVLDGSSFLKPRDSQRFFGRFGVKAFRVSSRAGARERLEQIEAAGLSVVLQEYVPGPSSDHYFIDGFRDASGVVRRRFARRRLRMYPPDFGNSTRTASVALADVAGAVRSLDAVLERLRYRGIFSAEFKRDMRDGEFKILEVNARPWWYVEFAARSGADVVTAYYRDALGMPVADSAGYRVGVSCIYVYYDYFACEPLRRAGAMSLTAMLAEWLRSYHPIFAWDDPGPSIWEAGQLLRRLRTRAHVGEVAR